MNDNGPSCERTRPPPEESSGRRRGRRRRDAEAGQELPPLRVPRGAETLRNETSAASAVLQGVGRRARRAALVDEEKVTTDQGKASSGPTDMTPSKIEVESHFKKPEMAVALDDVKNGGSLPTTPVRDVGTSLPNENACGVAGVSSISPSGPDKGNPSLVEWQGAQEGGQEDNAGERKKKEEEPTGAEYGCDRGRRALATGGEDGDMWGGARTHSSPERIERWRFKCPGSRNRGAAPSVMFRRVFLGVVVGIVIIIITRISIGEKSKVPAWET